MWNLPAYHHSVPFPGEGPSIPAQLRWAPESHSARPRSTRSPGSWSFPDFGDDGLYVSISLPVPPAHAHIVCRLPCHQTRVMSLFLTEVSSSGGNRSLCILSPVSWGEHELQLLLKSEWGTGPLALLLSPFPGGGQPFPAASLRDWQQGLRGSLGPLRGAELFSVFCRKFIKKYMKFNWYIENGDLHVKV